MAKQNPQGDLLDRVIANITEDQQALKEQNELIEKAKSYKAEIVNRLRDSKRDLATFAKYATPEQQKRLEELGMDVEELGGGLNKEAQLALDILQKTPKGEMTNGALYEEYVKAIGNPEDAEDYTHFNIRCRSLFNSQKLIRVKQEGQKSQDALIRINGFKPNN